jgi:hypothetical protein
MTKPVSVQQLNTLISKITFLNKNKMNRITTSKSIVYSVILWSSIVTVYGQVSQKIGGNAGTIDPKAVLELESTTKGFLLPRMTAVQVAAISNPTSGMMVFCTDCGVASDGELRISYNGVWQTLKGNLTGNITGTATNVTGTVAVANGGTGISSTPTNGQIDIGNGSGFTRATLTEGTAITITNNAGAITISAVIRPTTDQTTATAAQTSFTLAQTPMNSKVWMFINGVRTDNNAYTLSGTTLTYDPANNNGYVLAVGDRVQFDYCY